MKRLLRPVLLWAAGLSAGTALGQNITNAEYFLETDPGVGNGTPVTITSGTSVDQNFSLNTSGLEDGLHRLYIRTQQDNGLWSIPKVRFFYVSDPDSQEIIDFATDIIAAEYFYDTDPGPGKGEPIPLQKSALVDKNWVAKTTDLDTGSHRLYIRTQSQDGFWGVPDTLNIEINNTTCQIPNVDFSFDTVDINTNIGLIDLSTNVATGATYEWDVLDDGTVESTVATFDTQFAVRDSYPIRLTVTNPDGCSASVVKDVLVTADLPTALALSANDSLITGNTVELTAPAGYTYEWNTGATTQSITVSESGKYFAYLSADGITYATEKANIHFFQDLTTDFSAFDATSGLSNGAAFLDNIDSDGLPYTISWSTGATDVRSITGLAPGSYSVDVTTPLATYNFPFSIVDTTPSANSIVAAEYFIEVDPGPGNGEPIAIYQADQLNADFSLDLTGFEAGLHKLYTRVKSANGVWSIPKYRIFYVIHPNDPILAPFDFNLTSAEYYFDADPGIGNGIPVEVASGKTADIDFSHVINNLEGGLHTMYIRAQQDNGGWSLSRPITFFVIGGRFENIITFKTDIIEAEYFFDEDPGAGNGLRIPLQKTNDLQNRPWAAKTDGLAIGDHTLNIRVRSQDGIWNVINTQNFTINADECVPPVADFAFDTVGVETLAGITDLSTGLSDNVTYAWDLFGDGTIESTAPGFDTTFQAKGVYPLKLTVTNFPDSCFTSVVKDIYVTDGFPAEISANKGDSLLAGDSITYTAPDGFAYEWNTGDSTQSITVAASGTYFVWLTADGISYKSRAAKVNYFEEITANISVNGASAGVDNGAAALQNIATDGLPYQISWSNGMTNQTSVSGLALGTYQVTLSTVLDTITFTFNIGEVTLQGTEIMKAEYFFGDDPGPGNATPITTYQADEVDFDFTPDISELPVGLQRLYIRAQQADGLWGLPKVRFFYVIDPEERVYEEIDRNIVGAEYFIDQDPGSGNGIFLPVPTTKNADENFSLDVTNLSTGLHFLYLRTRQDDGIWSVSKRTPFFVIDTLKNDALFFKTDMVAAEYFFDDDPGVGKGIPIPLQKSDSISNRPWSAATAGLSQGKHKLNIRVQNQDGIWNTIKSTEVFLYPNNCDLPQANFSFDTVGVGVNVGLTDLSTNVLTDATYAWNILGDETIESTDPGFDLSFDAPGRYPIRLTVTNSEGCFTSLVKDVLVAEGLPGALTVSAGDSLLTGDTLSITAPAGYSYEWNTGDTLQTLEVTESGSYYAYISKDGLTFRSEKINVNFFEPIQSVLKSFDATGGLDNGAARLDSLDTDGLPVSISWSTGQADVNSIQNLAAGNYSVSISTSLETKTHEFDIFAGSPEPNSLIAAEYFIDSDPGPGQGQAIVIYQDPVVELSASAVLSGESEGTHDIYLRAKNDQGVWGPAVKRKFYILSTNNPLDNFSFGGNIVYAEYQLDSLPAPGQGIPIAVNPALNLDETFAVDVTGVTAGSHKIYLQVQDQSGNWSMREAEPFTICNSVPTAPTVSNQSGCPGSDYTLTVTDVAGTINWYDSLGTLLQSNTSTTYQLNNVQSTTSVFVTQVNAEGCESPKAEAVVNISDTEIFAGPDVETYSFFDAIQLKDEFPKGGVWSGSSYVDAQGIFSTSSSGLGTFNVTYSLDSGGCTVTDEKSIIVRQLDNDPPQILTETLTLAENPSINSLIGQIIATDADGDDLRYYGASAADTASISIDSVSGMVYVKDSAAFDFESNASLSFDIRVSDPFYDTDSTITISIQDVDEFPIMNDQTLELAENSAQGAVIGNVEASDPEMAELTFSIISGNESGALSLSAAGELTVADSAQFDFETNDLFELIVEVSDGGLTTSALITVNVNNMNEPPLIADLTFEIAENSTNGTELGNLNATDPDGDALTYTIVSGNTGNTFSVSTEGVLNVTDSTALDFESNPEFILVAEVSDGTNQVPVNITINLTNVNEAPILAASTFEIMENTPNGTELGNLNATDPEGDALTYTIVSGNTGNTFSVSTEGVLNVTDSTALDFESNPEFILVAEVSDGTNQVSVNITINLTNVNEAPILAASTFEIMENTPNGTELGNVNATDPEGDALTYQLINGNTSDAFAISSEGLLSVNNQEALDFETTPSFTVGVSVSDGTLTAAADITVLLTDEQEDVAAADSLALVAFYQATGGTEWTNNTGWLEEASPIKDWFGVTLEGVNITSIELSDNNLTGEVPNDILNLSSLQTLNLQNNVLTGIPVLTDIPGIAQINISGNQLQFAALEPIMSSEVQLTYSPQQRALERVRVIAELGADAIINRQISGSANNYAWFKDDQEFSETGAEFSVTAESFESEAVFYAVVTNDLVPDLAIETQPVVFRVSSLERDRLALLALYDALDGENWNQGADWPSLDLSEWQRINIQSNRVIGLDLSANNLSGSMPDDINDLLELTSINLSDNEIDYLPEITLTELNNFDVSENLLDFGDLEYNVDVAGINYAPQKRIDQPRTEYLSVGSQVSIGFEVDGSANIYEWFRNDEQISGATADTFNIPGIDYNSMGKYRLNVTNELVEGLTLSSAEQTLFATANIEFAPGFYYADESLGIVQEGESLLFRIRQGPYDTTAVVNIVNDKITYENIVLGNYILIARTEPDYTQTKGSDEVTFIPTYYESTIDHVEADVLELRDNIADTLFMQRQPPPLTGGDGVIELTVESEFAEGSSEDRVESRKKVKRAGCSLRRFVRRGRWNQEDVYELVAYLETNDDGEVIFGQIPSGRYRLNIQYPGIPMDPSSTIEFEISEEEEEDGYVLSAVVREDGISVEVVEQLGFYRKYFKNLGIFPNPADDVINLTYDKMLSKSVEVRLLSIDGREIHSERITRGYDQSLSLDVSMLVDGTYLLHFYDDSDPNAEVFVTKIIVKHH